MPFWNGKTRFMPVVLGIPAIALAGLVIVALSGPRFRWRIEVVELKATGHLPDITWKELYGLHRRGDPFNLKDLVTTRSAYFAIKNPYISAEDVEHGEKLFQSNCSFCHGANGVGGGAGPALKQRTMERGTSDWALFKTVSYGIGGTAMPPSSLPEIDRWRLTAFVKSLAEGTAVHPASPLGVRIAQISPVRYEDILSSARDSHQWLTYSGSYDGQRFSPNDQITTANASNLRLLWMRQITTTEPYIETSPLVVEGFMFITLPPNRVEALDARTGELIWSYDRRLPEHLSACCGFVNRGLAVLGNLLYFGTLDSHLVALDIKTGAVAWDAEIASYREGYSITSAPLALKNIVITGVAGGEYGIRGFVDARDAATGKEVWRFNTIPQPGQPGSETWEPEALKTGGGPTWLTGTYDPDLNVVYWPVGNPSPNYNGADRKGDNLYADCVVALDADHGTLKWYFQFTPHDVYDWDATEILVAFDKTVAGKRERLLGQADRNAFYYVLDRETGHFLTAHSIAKQTWATEIDSHGRPVVNPAATPTPEGSMVFPSGGGATNWMSPSYSPVTGLMYVPVREWGGVFYSKADTYHAGEFFLGGSSQILNDPAPVGIVRALDASTGEIRWEYDRNTSSFVGGLLSTKGGVVFGSAGQAFFALDARSGRELWRIETGGWIKAAPVTYSIGGKQMITIAAGHDLLTFGLSGLSTVQR
jgi:alcohol dehydrogenase (cytochrome c)